MGDVTPLKPKKKHKRIRVSVTWGGFQVIKSSEHIASKDPHVDTDSGVLVVTEGESVTCYPIGSVFNWSEKDEPDESD